MNSPQLPRSRTQLAYERSDVCLLNEWLEEMLSQAIHLNKELPFLSLYMDMASIYTGAIGELVRQINKHSKDQGNMVERIWNDNLNIIVKQLKKMEQQCSDLDLLGIKEVSRVHEGYTKFIQAIHDKQIKNTEFQLELKKQMEVLKRENVYLRKKEIRREHEQQLLIKQQENLVIKNLELNQELINVVNFQKQYQALMEDQQKKIEHQPAFLSLTSVQKSAIRKSLQVQPEEEDGGEIQAKSSNKGTDSGIPSKKKYNQSLLSQVRENQNNDVEEEEQLRQLKYDVIQHYDHVMFKDEQTDTIDLAPLFDKTCDTSDFVKVTNKEVQAVVNKYYATVFVQATEKTSSKNVQTNLKVVASLSTEQMYLIGQSKNNYQQQVVTANTQTIKQVISTLIQIQFPLEIKGKTIQLVPKITADQFQAYSDNLSDLSMYLSHKQTLDHDDINEFMDYSKEMLIRFHDFFKLKWELVLSYNYKHMDEQIIAYERKLDLEIVQDKLKYNSTLYKKLHYKFTAQKQEIERLVDKLEDLVKRQPKLITVDSYKNSQNSPSSDLHKQSKLSKGEDQKIQAIFNWNKIKTIKSNQTIISSKNILEQEQPKADISLEKRRKAQEFSEFIQADQILELRQVLSSSSSDGSDSEPDESMLEVQNLKIDLNILKTVSIFEKKFRIGKILNKFAEQATSLIQITLKQFNQFNNAGIHKEQNLLVQLSSYLFNYIKRLQVSTQLPFYVFIYEIIINKESCLQALAAFKFQKFIRSVLYYQNNNKRFSLFAKFFQGDFDSFDFQFYLLILSYFDETHQKGIGLFVTQYDEYISCACPKNPIQISLLMNCKDSIELQETFYQIDLLKVMNSTQTLKFSVDVDIMSIILLNFYQLMRQNQAQEYVDLFNAVDIDKSGLIQLDQTKLKCDQIIKIFTQEADYVETNQKVMSLKRFIIICDELHLISKEKIQQLINDSDISMDKWPTIRRHCKLNLIQSQRFSQLVRKICSCVDTGSNQNTKVVRLMIALIQITSKDKLQEYYIESWGMPGIFNDLQAAYRNQLIQKYSKQ